MISVSSVVQQRGLATPDQVMPDPIRRAAAIYYYGEKEMSCDIHQMTELKKAANVETGEIERGQSRNQYRRYGTAATLGK